MKATQYNHYKPSKLSEILTFGKYKGSTIMQVIDADPEYIDWVVESTDNFNLNYMAIAYLEKTLEKYRSMKDDYGGEDDYEYDYVLPF